MPDPDAAKNRAVDIGHIRLKPLHKAEIISKAQYKEILQSVSHSVRANYNGEPLDSTFEKHVGTLLDAKTNEVRSASEAPAAGAGVAAVAAREVQRPRARPPARPS